MIAYAEAEFRRSRVQPDGAPLSAHEESAARQFAMLGKKPKQTAEISDGPVLPHAIQYLWNWFVEIADGIQYGGMSQPNLSWQQLHAWSVLTRRTLEPWEAATLVRLGMLHAIAVSEKKA